MGIPRDFTFQEYLVSKKTVDDRALNETVWQAVAQALPPSSAGRPLEVLEVGAGTGAMFERMLARRLISYANYTALDEQSENTAFARQELPDWGLRQGFQAGENEQGDIIFENDQARTVLKLAAADLFDHAADPANQGKYDLVAAHAVLDLLDVPTALPALFGTLKPGGLFYFTINFDGGTIFEPSIDPALDSLIERLYHQTMDERVSNGRPSGDSRSGRHLFAHLTRAGATVLAVGASDWVVFPIAGRYPARESYFLHFIIHTIQNALHRHVSMPGPGYMPGYPELDPACFAEWIQKRHAQIEQGELVYIAHQLDFAGRVDPRK